MDSSSSRDHHQQRRNMQQEQNLGRVILKTCQALRNNNTPLSQSDTKNVLDGIHNFYSHYTPPDHPPYHLMIERAIRELNENGGSTMETISEFLQKEYPNLPLAHLTLLKHHLARLCESGSIFVSWGSKYVLSMMNNSPNSTRGMKIRNMPMGRRAQSNRPFKKQAVENAFQQQGSMGFVQKHVAPGFQNRVYGEEDTVNRLLPRKLDFGSNFQHQFGRELSYAKAPDMLVREEEKYRETQDLVRLFQQEKTAGMSLANEKDGEEQEEDVKSRKIKHD